MANRSLNRDSTSAPSRGDTAPTLVGVRPDGTRTSTRNFYMRRNLAIMFVGDDARGQEWIDSAASVHDAARDEVGEIVVVAPNGMGSRGLITLVDDGSLRQQYGLTHDDLPALFVADRYGTVFVSSHGERAEPDLHPRDIPRWLEFIACRCT